MARVDPLWRQERIDGAMQPFMLIADQVIGNQRKPYARVGSYNRYRKHPKYGYRDSYSAIKVPGVHAVFICFIKNRGDSPTFELFIRRGSAWSQGLPPGDHTIEPETTFSEDQLERALAEWKAIARSAAGVVE